MKEIYTFFEDFKPLTVTKPEIQVTYEDFISIENFNEPTIIRALKHAYKDDINDTIFYYPLNKKYFITDKGVIFSTKREKKQGTLYYNLIKHKERKYISISTMNKDE